MAASTEGRPIIVLPQASLVSISLGPLLAGVMIGHLLLGIVCFQAATYFRHQFQGDGQFIRLVVISLVTLNIFVGIMDFVSVYQSTILDFGDFDRFDLQDWTTWAEPGVTACVAFIAHTFYVYRCWMITRSLLVAIFLSFVALLAWASGITVTVFAFALGRLSKTAEAMTPCYIWLLSVLTGVSSSLNADAECVLIFPQTSICDICIATILAVYFWRNSSVVRSTYAMFSHLRRISLETGSLTAMCALINIVLFASPAPAAYYLLIKYSMAHVYTLSVLYTLLSRQDLRQIISTRSSAPELDQSSPMFTSVFNHSNFRNTTIRHYTKNLLVEDSVYYDDIFTGDSNANSIPMHHIRHHDSDLLTPAGRFKNKPPSSNFGIEDGEK